MALWKHYIVLFGGFFDTYTETRYMDDLWIFDTNEYKWQKVEFPPNSNKPTARSGFQMFTHDDAVVIYGGYSKIVSKGEKSKGMIHTDMWALRMSADIKQLRWEKRKKSGMYPSPRSGFTGAIHKNRAILFGGIFDEVDDDEHIESVCYNDMFAYFLDSNKWFPLTLRKAKKQKKKNKKAPAPIAPTHPQPAAPSQDSDEEESAKQPPKKTYHYDDDFRYDEDDFEYLEDDEYPEGADEPAAIQASEAKDVSSPEQSPAKKRPEEPQGRSANAAAQSQQQQQQSSSKKKADANQSDSAGSASSSSSSSSSSSTSAAAAVTTTSGKSVVTVDAKSASAQLTQKPQQEEEEEKVLQPSPRFNSMIVVQKGILFVFGGVYEIGDREVTLDDIWSINLDKLNEWKCIKECNIEAQKWNLEESDDDDDDDDDDESDCDDDSDDDEDDGDDDEDDEDDGDDDDDADNDDDGKEGKQSSTADKDSAYLGKGGEGTETVKLKKAKTEESTETGTLEEAVDDANKKVKKEKNKKKENAEEGVSGDSKPSGEKKIKEDSSKRCDGRRDRSERLKAIMNSEADLSTPKIGEKLNEFFTRTSEYWIKNSFETDSSEKGKSLRQQAFMAAKARFDEMKPILDEIDQLEKEAAEEEEQKSRKKGKERHR